MSSYEPTGKAFIESIREEFGGFHLYQSKSGDNYFSLGSTRGGEVFPLHGQSMKFLNLIRKYLKMPRGREKESAETMIAELLESDLGQNLAKEDIFIRSGRDKENRVIIDLRRDEQSFVIISKDEIKIEDSCSIPFIRSSNMLPMPIPQQVHHTDFRNLWENHFELKTGYGPEFLMAFVAHSLVVNNGSYPILVLEGEQGSGKSTMTKKIKQLIDPTSPLLQGVPPKEDELFITVNSNHLLAFDNLSHITSNQADLLCRVATGGGFTRRKLYTDDCLKTYEVKKPLIFNGITELSERPDFLDRCLILRTKPITKRKSENKLENDFKNDSPKLLWGIFEIIKCYLNLPNDSENNSPRMVEYTLMGKALDSFLKRSGPEFLELYQNHLDEKKNLAFHDSSLCLRIEELLNEKSLRGDEPLMRGSIVQLTELITRGRPSFYGLRNTPKSLKNALNRLRPLLSSREILFYDEARTNKQRLFVIEKRVKNESART